MRPLAYSKINELESRLVEEIPCGFKFALEVAYQRSLIKATLAVLETERLFALFHANQLPVVVMRGVVLGMIVYEKLGLRPFSDIDLFTDGGHAEGLGQALLAFGYTQHLTHRHTGEVVDVPIGLRRHYYRFSYEDYPFKRSLDEDDIPTCQYIVRHLPFGV